MNELEIIRADLALILIALGHLVKSKSMKELCAERATQIRDWLAANASV
jgi:hypothetical protein